MEHHRQLMSPGSSPIVGLLRQLGPRSSLQLSGVLYALHCTALHCTALHCTALFCTDH